MAYGDVWTTKLIIDVTVEASTAARAEQRWENVLEKLKYQVSNVKIEIPMEPNWQLVEKVEKNDDATQ